MVGIMMRTRLKHTDAEEIVKNMQSAEVSTIYLCKLVQMSSVSVLRVYGADNMVSTVCVS